MLSECQGFPCFPLCPSPPTHLQWVEGWVVVDTGLGGDTTGKADPNWPRGYPIPYDIMLSDKSSRRDLRKGDNQNYSICLSKQQLYLLSSAFHEVCEHLLLLGSSEWIPLFALLMCAIFTFPVNLSLPWCRNHISFILFFPVPLESGVS